MNPQDERKDPHVAHTPESSLENSDESNTDSPNLQEVLHNKLEQSSLGNIGKETLSGQDLLKSVGGVRGIIETVIPSLAFIIVYLITDGDLVISVATPVALGVIALLIRVVTRIDPTPAISGIVGLTISALLAYFSGDIMQHFLLGLVSNSALLLVFVVSIFMKKPIIGFVTALMKEIPMSSFTDAQRRLMNIATWAWVGLFVLRLTIQLPLYFQQAAAELALIRIITGVPLLIGVLWISWFCVKIAFPSNRVDSSNE